MRRRHKHGHRTLLLIWSHCSACLRVHHTTMMMIVQRFVGAGELAFISCPARAGRRRPHTYAERCRKATPLATPGATAHHNIMCVLVVSPDRVLAGPPPDRDEHHPGATLSEDPRPPSLEPPPGASSDMSVPCERPNQVTQKPRDAPAAMPDILS